MYHRVQPKRRGKGIEFLHSGAYPNGGRSVAALAKSANAALNELDDLRCPGKTVGCGVELLKEAFHYSLAFDRQANGHCRTDRGWHFFCPEMPEETFTPAFEIRKAAKPGNFLPFKPIPDIRIRFHRSLHDSPAKPLHNDQVIDFDETSEYLTFHLPECSEEVVFPWVLAQMSKAEILEPESLRKYLKESADSIIFTCKT